MDKKGVSTWILQNAVKLIISAMIVLILFFFLNSTISSMSSKRSLRDQSMHDLDRLAMELRDIYPGEIITIPVLGADHEIRIRKSEEVNLEPCPDNFCACLYDNAGVSTGYCREVEIRDTLTLDYANIPLDFSSGITIDATTSQIRFS